MLPFKSVAVTPIKRGGGRKAPSPTVAEDAPIGLAPRLGRARSIHDVPARPVHRYRVGDRLRMNGGGQIVQRAAGGCSVVALLPDEGYGALQYRVRSDVEDFDRIVAEADLLRQAL